MPADRSSTARAPKIERVYTDVILPIKPHFVDLIVSGKKNHEYRKYRLRESVLRLWLYEVPPSSKIRYLAETERPKVPGEVNDPSGIGNDDFDKGLKISKFGYRIIILFKLASPVSSHQLKQKFAVSVPQSYCFLPKAMLASIDIDELESVNLPPATPAPQNDSACDA